VVDILTHYSGRELPDPQKLLPYLLQPEVDNLGPDTIAIYVQTAVKVFGFWASGLAQRWETDDLNEVKHVVGSIIDRLRELASSQHIEVQERVRRTTIEI